MSITLEQERQIQENIGKLDYLNGTGMMSKSKKHLAKELFLFISSGGVGRRAMTELKTMLEQQVEPDEIKDQIMFLAIDTDLCELEMCNSRGLFASEELLKIPYLNARALIDPGTISDAVKDWIHPALFNETNTEGFFCGMGASAMRQCGRVLFCQGATQRELKNKLMNVRHKAAKLAARGIANPRLKVFLLAGIAGGTGSGTIVDLAFLTRYYLRQILPGWDSKIDLLGYIFLPSASCSNPISKIMAERGNKNAYACLKEINYFMTLKNRQETFTMDYGILGANNVEIKENIFDFCTLVEGIANGGVLFRDAAQTARVTTGLSIMNIICQDDNQSGFFWVDPIISSKFMETLSVIANNSDRHMPREADYIYSIIGYSSCIVPIELLTIYAFKKVFDVVYENCNRNAYANKDVARKFLKSCHLEFDRVAKIAKTISKSDVDHSLDAACERYFKHYGPYFMVNLTKEAVDLIWEEPNDFMKKAIKKENALISDKQKWNAVHQIYEYATEYLLIKKTQLFEVYPYVIRALRDLLEDNVKLLTDTKLHDVYFGQSFQWSPIDLTHRTHATRAVNEYLDDIMNPQETRRLAAKFVNDLYAQRDKWADLAPKEQGGKLSFDAASSIRSFIMGHMNSIVNTTLESFIVKAYSGNKNAQVSVTDQQGNEIPSQDTINAARIILDKLIVSSNPLAATGNGYVLNNAYHNLYLTIPDNCPWLYQVIEESGRIQKNNIFKSSTRDSLVMSVVYSGVPAWALTWVPTAEENYESGDGPKEIGIHIEQSNTGRDWSELPNLYPERLWTNKQKQKRLREAGISADIRGKMDLAKKKGLVIRDTYNRNYYDLLVFSGAKSAREIADSVMLSNKKYYDARSVYDMLVKAGEARFERLEYACMVMTDDTIRGDEAKETFTWNLASRVVRKVPALKKKLEHTLEVAEEIEKCVKKYE